MAANDPLLIGNNIRKWRIIKGFKQVDLAHLIGISTSTLSKIENDKLKISLPRLQQIAQSMHIKTTQLFMDPESLLPPPTDNF
jgi:transcriptional regulator with XRE-family HTH domain